MTTLQKIQKMAEMPALEIISNENGNRQFPTICNISGNPMIEFYHGIGSGNAIVDKINDEVRGFLYYSDDDDSIEISIENSIEEIKGLENCVVWSCEFSATQILFPKK
jgi:hypothetical protein